MTQALTDALAVLKQATSFATKKARDGHAKAVADLEAAIAAQPAPWSQQDADEWGARHDLRIHGNDLFCAFEDAATLQLTRRNTP